MGVRCHVGRGHVHHRRAPGVAEPDGVLVAAVVYVGLISYPLYLWHWPLLSFLRIVEIEDLATYRLLRMLMVVLAIALAILTYHLVERPVRRRNDLRRIGAWLGLLMLALAAWGVVILAADGFPRRTTLREDPIAWPRALRNQPRCMEVHGYDPELRDETLCVRNDYDHAPQIVLLGDSACQRPVARSDGGVCGSSVLNIGGSACVYLRHTDFWHDAAPGSAAPAPIDRHCLSGDHP